MIFSPARLVDLKFREQVLNDLEWAISMGYTETAQSIGELSATLKKRIDTHDYKREDAYLEWEAKLFTKPPA